MNIVQYQLERQYVILIEQFYKGHCTMEQLRKKAINQYGCNSIKRSFTKKPGLRKHIYTAECWEVKNNSKIYLYERSTESGQIKLIGVRSNAMVTS